MSDSTSAPDVAGALEVARQFGHIDGSHHKDWVIDQMVRHLTSCPLVDKINTSAVGGSLTYKGLGESEAYREFIAGLRWDEGIAP
jgi:hypothetical protein